VADQSHTLWSDYYNIWRRVQIVGNLLRRFLKPPATSSLLGLNILLIALLSSTLCLCERVRLIARGDLICLQVEVITFETELSLCGLKNGFETDITIRQPAPPPSPTACRNFQFLTFVTSNLWPCTAYEFTVYVGTYMATFLSFLSLKLLKNGGDLQHNVGFEPRLGAV
jgi:hypothetical protein